MAKRRMISIEVSTAHFFRKLPLGAQALYFQFVARADDDGFVSDADGIRVSIKARKSDLEVLVDRRYLLRFDSGIYVIKHWGMANRVDSRQYAPTLYREERALLVQRSDGSWTDHSVPPDMMADCSERNDNRLWLEDRNTHENSRGKSAEKTRCFPAQDRTGENILREKSFTSDDEDDDHINIDANNGSGCSSSSSEECTELFRKYGKTCSKFDIEKYCFHIRRGDPPDNREKLALAFDAAANAGLACNWNYITGVLKKWDARGHRTVDDIIGAEAERDIKKSEWASW